MDPRGEAWEARKRRYYQTHRRECRKCGYKGRKAAIHLHHLYYLVPFGQEPDDHLMPLCKLCHRGVHALAVAKGLPVYAATALFSPAPSGRPQAAGVELPDLVTAVLGYETPEVP